MPNHVHILFKVLPNNKLEEVTHSWKSFTSNQANKLLKRTGRFWQVESYDHLVRNQESFYRITRYIQNNPAKAGLKNWHWVSNTGILPVNK
jgi:REP element-mobilizing transposase RayT